MAKSSRGKTRPAQGASPDPVAAGPTAASGSLPDYGLDYPKTVSAMFARTAWIVGFALILFFINLQEYPGPASRMAGAIILIALVFAALGAYMRWSSQTGKFALRDQLVDRLGLTGEEKVLDVGCGRGLMSIAIAKKLDAGKVTALDAWNADRIAGNSQESIRDNAQQEGVAPKLRIERGDLIRLGYQDASFDVVVSVAALQDFDSYDHRAQMVSEMIRVLKPGGRLLIYDRFTASEYAPIVHKSSFTDIEVSSIRYLWAIPAQTIFARKLS